MNYINILPHITPTLSSTTTKLKNILKHCVRCGANKTTATTQFIVHQQTSSQKLCDTVIANIRYAKQAEHMSNNINEFH